MSLSPVIERGEAMPSHIRGRQASQLATCQRKRPQTEDQAVKIALMYGFPMTAYVCMGCGCWHNGRRYSSPFHNVDHRLRNPYRTREKYLAREREKEAQWLLQSLIK